MLWLILRGSPKRRAPQDDASQYVATSPALRIQRRRHAAHRRPPDQAADLVGRRHESWHVDAGRNPHALKHVDHVFGSDITRGAGCVGTAAEAASGGIDHAAALLHPGLEIGQRLALSL